MALPRAHRLRGRRSFDRLHRDGRRFHAPHMLLRLVVAEPSLLPAADARAPSSPWRCGLVISSKVSKRAVVRNRLRRLIHCHLLQVLPGRPQPSPDLPGHSPDLPGHSGDGAASPGPSEPGPAVPPAVPQAPPLPLWLLISLRPGCAELSAAQLLGECDALLRRAGLSP